jgi:hypothetical protein
LTDWTLNWKDEESEREAPDIAQGDGMKIDKSKIGAFAGSDEWWSWTTPEDTQEHVSELLNGVVVEEEIVVWEDATGTVELICDRVEKFATLNNSGEKFYLIPPGTKARIEVIEPLTSEDNGLHSWDEPESGETYCHTITAKIILEF